MPLAGEIASDVRSMPPNPIRGIEPVLAIRSNRGDVIHPLHIGNRSDPLDPIVTGALQEALTDGNCEVLPYVQAAGTPEMRQACATYFNGLYTPDQIVVTAGASEAMLLSTLITQEPGEANVVFPPAYPNYWAYGTSTGREVLSINRDPNNNFRYPSPGTINERLDRSLAAGVKPVSMTIVAPDNPTGVIPTEAELLDMFGVAQQRGLWMFGDLAYNHLSPPGSLTIDDFLKRHPEFLPNTILAASVSKEYRGCGARLGWVASVASKYIASFTQLAAARGSVNSISQKIFPGIIRQNTDRVREDYLTTIQPRADAVGDALEHLTHGQINVPRAQGGIYSWVDLAGIGIANTADFTAFMANTYGETEADGRTHTVTVAPGTGFYGKDDPEAPQSYARIALTETPDMLAQDMGILVRGAEAYLASRLI
jgi:aspartate/methionine/tyrosine aminotransferase